MNHHRWLFALFVGCLVVAQASCGSTRSSRPEDDDDDGAGGSGASSTGSVNPSTSSSGAGGSGGSGGTCSKGGEPCLSFSDCCSGECANQVCSACGDVGEACGQGCCPGLTCSGGACSQCSPTGAVCSLASDCCSNVCNQGTCGEACSPPGIGCFSDSDCCSGFCTNGVCEAMGCVRCGEYLTENVGVLCSESQALWDELQSCVCFVCEGPCAESCAGGEPTPGCNDCSQSAFFGPCQAPFNECANDI